MTRIHCLDRARVVFCQLGQQTRVTRSQSNSGIRHEIERDDDECVRSIQNLTRHLSSNKIFENEKIVCYNKPPGIHSHTTRFLNQSLAMEDIQHQLAKDLNCESLRVCQAPHSLYSGATILAKSDSAAEAVRSIFHTAKKRQEYIKTDLAITIGIPSPESDIIKIPVEKKEVNGAIQALPILNPSKTKLKQDRMKKRRTRYKVLDSTNGMALVELQPRDGLGQLSLLHITCKMCKVLGDKEFSNRIVKVNGVSMLLDPEKVQIGTKSLDHRTKQLLGVCTAEHVQNLPLHVHRWKLDLPKCKELDLPNGVVITAPLPKYFVVNLQKLGLKVP